MPSARTSAVTVPIHPKSISIIVFFQTPVWACCCIYLLRVFLGTLIIFQLKCYQGAVLNDYDVIDSLSSIYPKSLHGYFILQWLQPLRVLPYKRPFLHSRPIRLFCSLDFIIVILILHHYTISRHIHLTHAILTVPILERMYDCPQLENIVWSNRIKNNLTASHIRIQIWPNHTRSNIFGFSKTSKGMGHSYRSTIAPVWAVLCSFIPFLLFCSYYNIIKVGPHTAKTEILALMTPVLE